MENGAFESTSDWNWMKNIGGSEHEIAEVEEHFGISFPIEYKRFLLWSDGGEGFIGKSDLTQGDYAMLWRASEIIRWNVGYDIPRYLQQIIGIGSNGGGNCFAFDFRNPTSEPSILTFDFIDGGHESLRRAAHCFRKWFATDNALLHDHGDYFPAVTLNPRWLTSTVLDLARTIYDERVFERMPILADALMDSGCDSEEIINHCQGPGPHVRGCWVVDLLLGKE